MSICPKIFSAVFDLILKWTRTNYLRWHRFSFFCLCFYNFFVKITHVRSDVILKELVFFLLAWKLDNSWTSTLKKCRFSASVLKLLTLDEGFRCVQPLLFALDFTVGVVCVFYFAEENLRNSMGCVWMLQAISSGVKRCREYPIVDHRWKGSPSASTFVLPPTQIWSRRFNVQKLPPPPWVEK